MKTLKYDISYCLQRVAEELGENLTDEELQAGLPRSGLDSSESESASTFIQSKSGVFPPDLDSDYPYKNHL